MENINQEARTPKSKERGRQNYLLLTSRIYKRPAINLPDYSIKYLMNAVNVVKGRNFCNKLRIKQFHKIMRQAVTSAGISLRS